MNPSLAIGIDLGGIKIAGALASRQGEVLTTIRRPTEAGRGLEAVLDSLAGSIAELPAQVGGQCGIIKRSRAKNFGDLA